jgi:Ca2+-binding EF-hand superfamily protein
MNNLDDGEISFEEFASVVGGQYYRSHSDRELRQAFM